jgi:hypothetical protein
MTKRFCPACEQELRAEALPPICPTCGHDLVAQPPVEGWRVGGWDLLLLARGYRWLVAFTLLIVVIDVLFVLLRESSVAVMMPIAIGYVIALAAALWAAWLVMGSMGISWTHRVPAVVIATGMPCAHLLLLFWLAYLAERAFRLAGLRESFVGPTDEAIVRRFGAYRCHRCGYKLIGNRSGVCPECGTPDSASSTAADEDSKPPT